jgi:hypothetical protein
MTAVAVSLPAILLSAGVTLVQARGVPVPDYGVRDRVLQRSVRMTLVQRVGVDGVPGYVNIPRNPRVDSCVQPALPLTPETKCK